MEEVSVGLDALIHNIPPHETGGTMRIVDSQLHVWTANTPQRPWPAGRDKEAQRPYPISKEALLFQMDLAGVDSAILVPPSWEGDRNDLALDAARTHPERFSVMGRFPLQNPANHVLIPDWKKQPGMLGMRFTFHNEHNRHFLTQRTADWLWPLAEQHAIPVMVLAPGIMHELARIAHQHPGLRLVIDHAGLPVN
jgi:L-fuconolactonase